MTLDAPPAPPRGGYFGPPFHSLLDSTALGSGASRLRADADGRDACWPRTRRVAPRASDRALRIPAQNAYEVDPRLGPFTQRLRDARASGRGHTVALENLAHFRDLVVAFVADFRLFALELAGEVLRLTACREVAAQPHRDGTGNDLRDTRRRQTNGSMTVSGCPTMTGSDSRLTRSQREPITLSAEEERDGAAHVSSRSPHDRTHVIAETDHVNPIKRLWSALGPGVITGAADDDPSGIATYSIAGAQFGNGFLWSALLTWPLMAAVQTMCARIGMVTGRGLMAALKKKFPRSVLATACFALLAANIINIGADLAGMADAAELLSGINSHLWVVVFAVLIGWATVRLRYAVVAQVLKWLALVLFAYVITAFKVGPQWRSVFHDTFLPTIPRTRDALATLVAILGTTISPYLFFWQASQEVEEEKALGRHSLVARRGASGEEIARRKLDVGVGTFFSNLAMFFIILTTSLTLHRAGLTHIETSRDVAKALEPLAGRFATLLYTLGLVGVGALAIPTLAGSAA